jgi:group I intron endonuclease
MNQHRCASRRRRYPIESAIAKHGWENFTAEILEAVDVDALNDAERYWIARCETFGPGGYNLDAGGSHGKVLSEASRLKIGLARAGRPTRLGHRHTDEAKQLMSKSRKGVPLTPRQMDAQSRRLLGNKNKPRGVASGNNKITPEDAGEIRRLCRAGYRQADAGALFGISQSQVSKIMLNHMWPE